MFSKVVVWLRTWRQMKVESVCFPILKSELDFVTTARNDALLKSRGAGVDGILGKRIASLVVARVGEC